MRTFNNIYSLNLIRFIIDQISRTTTTQFEAARAPKQARHTAATQLTAEKLVSVQGIPAESEFRGRACALALSRDDADLR